MNGYAADPWTDFAVATAGASAALAGLVFVAVSLNLRTILGDAHLPGRAAQTLVLLATPLFLALAILVPGQGEIALAVELAVLGVLAGAALLSRARPGRRSAEQPVVAWVLSVATPSLAVLVAPLLAALGLLTGVGGGLYWIPLVVLLALVGGLGNAWVLLVEILR